MNDLRKLVIEAGLGPWMTYPEWEAMLQLGEGITNSIQLPIPRASFVARAASDLEETNPAGIARNEGLKRSIEYSLDRLETDRPTPQGSTELWESAIQEIVCQYYKE